MVILILHNHSMVMLILLITLPWAGYGHHSTFLASLPFLYPYLAWLRLYAAHVKGLKNLFWILLDDLLPSLDDNNSYSSFSRLRLSITPLWTGKNHL